MEFVSYDIASNDFRQAGAASRAVKEHLKRIGAEAEAIRRTMIAAYEAEMNVVIHSVGGRLEACLSDSQIDVNVVDEGPGIPDVEQAMVEGFSTASAEARALGFGAGMGLPNIKRSSDRLRVTSRVGEGTRVSFTVYLKPEAVRAGERQQVVSLYASADRCRDCRACLTACPTQAMRVRQGRPALLEHLCIDCTNCIAACATGALSVREEITSLDQIENKPETLLVVPPALLAGCGGEYTPAQVLAGLHSLGFADVLTSAPYEQALREAAVQTAENSSRTPARPLIVPTCPAVVNLVELRFPSLVPNLAPFDSPWEGVQATVGDRRTAYVVSCPGQRSALLAHAEPPANASGGTADPTPEIRAEYLAPEIVREAVMVVLTGGTPGAAAGRAGEVTPAAKGGAADSEAPVAAQAAAATRGPAGDAASPAPQTPWMDVLTVTGTRHVIAVLEDVENGLLDDVEVIDPYACEGGCFGSPLLAEDYHVALRRWSRGAADVQTGGGAAVGRRRPYAPRPGIRLDADMGRAIQKLAHLQATLRALPGRDCGACGAPTCASLAEDVVMERATVEVCPYIATGSADKEA